jgi:hypothetical protein
LLTGRVRALFAGEPDGAIWRPSQVGTSAGLGKTLGGLLE